MQTIIQAKNMEVTDAMRQSINQQIKRKISKVGHKISKIRVYLEHLRTKNSQGYTAKVTFEIEKPGKNVVVCTKAYEFYDAVVDATNSALRQLRKLKEKKITLKRK